MYGLYKLKAFIAYTLIHLLQAHALKGTQADGKVRSPGASLAGIPAGKVSEASLEGIKPGHKLVYIGDARAAYVVSPLIRIAVHLYDGGSAQNLRKTLCTASYVIVVPFHQAVHKQFRGHDAIEVKVTKGGPFQFELTVAFKDVDDCLHLRCHYVVHLTAQPHLVEMVVGVVKLDQPRNLKEGGVIGKILILDLLRALLNKVPQKPHVPFHKVGHPFPRLLSDIAVKLLHQLGFAETGAELPTKDISKVLELRLSKAAQGCMKTTLLHFTLCVLILQDRVTCGCSFIRA